MVITLEICFYVKVCHKLVMTDCRKPCAYFFKHYIGPVVLFMYLHVCGSVQVCYLYINCNYLQVHKYNANKLSCHKFTYLYWLAGQLAYF